MSYLRRYSGGPTHPRQGSSPPVEHPPRRSLLALRKPLGQCLQAHMDRQSPQERRHLEFAPYFGAWANSIVPVLEAVRKLLKQQTIEDVVDIFGQREWYPGMAIVMRHSALCTQK